MEWRLKSNLESQAPALSDRCCAPFTACVTCSGQVGHGVLLQTYRCRQGIACAFGSLDVASKNVSKNLLPITAAGWLSGQQECLCVKYVSLDHPSARSSCSLLTPCHRPRHQLPIVHPPCRRAQVEVRDTRVGDSKDHTQHSIVGGSPGAPALVCLPGYGAGSGFYFRNLRDMCRHFRTYLTDPLGTGMSGGGHVQSSSAPSLDSFMGLVCKCA